MPVIFLKNRAGHLVERMDDPDCDPVRLNTTYRQFRIINNFISGWNRLYSRYLRPALSRGAETILDIGSGGGDVPRMILKWAQKDNLNVRISATDTDDRAVRYMRSGALPPEISVTSISTDELLSGGNRFDIVLSNNVLHHIAENDLVGFADQSKDLARFLVLHSDIRRDDLAYLGFFPAYLFFRGSFITEDGLVSIRKSYRTEELREILSSDWDVRAMVPYRNLCVWKHQ